MITETRAYIDARVKEIDPLIDPYDSDPQNNEDTDSILREKYYKIIFNDTRMEYIGQQYGEETDISVVFYSVKLRDEQSAFDSLYEKVLNIKNCIINPITVKNTTDFTEILADRITPDTEATDDNAFNVTLELRLRRDFTFT